MLLLKDSPVGSFRFVANPTLIGPIECSKISPFWEDVTRQVQVSDPPDPRLRGHRHTEWEEKTVSPSQNAKMSFPKFHRWNILVYPRVKMAAGTNT